MNEVTSILKKEIDFQVLFEAVPELFLILEPHSPSFTILAASDAYLQATLTKRNEIVGKKLFEVFPDNPDDPTATGTNNLKKSLEQVLRKKEAHIMAVQKYDIPRPASEGGGFEERHWSPLNTPVLDKNDKVVYIIHRVKDITEFVRLEQKRMEQVKSAEVKLHKNLLDIKSSEEKIKTSEILLQSSIENLKDIVVLLIDTHYQHLKFNAAHKQSMESCYKKEAAVGMNLLDCITHDSDREKTRINFARALAGENHTTIEEFGEWERRYYETRYCPIFNEKNEIIGAASFATNITERKKAEEQLLETNKELEFFSYAVSHDLRAPLRAIHSYTKILEEDYKDKLDEEGKKAIETILKNSKRMEGLLDDLLTFSRLGKKELTSSDINMNSLVKNTARDFLTRDIKNQINLNMHTIPPASGDSTLIKQVWVNLISNAIKYSSKKETTDIHIGCIEKANKNVYYIKDNGVGFDMNYYSKLFEVFQRLHSTEEFEGTGIGLAVVQKIIQKHHGEVWAESKLNEGATFYFSLPKLSS